MIFEREKAASRGLTRFIKSNYKIHFNSRRPIPFISKQKKINKSHHVQVNTYFKCIMKVNNICVKFICLYNNWCPLEILIRH